MTLPVGTKLSRYTLDAHIGRGGMADVYLATDDVSGARVALKVLHVRGEEVNARLLREARTQGSLRHPNVLEVICVINVMGAPALVMEWVEGPSLQEFLSRQSLTIEQLDTLALGMLSGLAAAHEEGLVHRDLKPANVLLASVDGEAVAKIADFGLVAVAEQAPGAPLTRTGAGMGTLGYAAPEQLRDARHADARADVFSAGATLFRMAAGRQPFPQRDLQTYLDAIAAGAFPQLSADALGERAALIGRCLSADPASRPSDGGELLRVWSAIASQQAPSMSASPPIVGRVVAADTWSPQPSSWVEQRAVLVLRGAPQAMPPIVSTLRGVWLPGDDEVVCLLRGVEQSRVLLAALPGVQGGMASGPVSLRENTAAAVSQGAHRLQASGATLEQARQIAALAPPGVVLGGEGSDALGESVGWWQLAASPEPLALWRLGGESPVTDGPTGWQVQAQGERWLPVRPPPTVLPRETDAFIGRAPERRALASLFRSSRGGVTVLGPGGVGKTRFVQNYAWRQLGAWPGGVWFCDVSEARTADGVLGAVSRALEVSLTESDPVSQLGRAIQTRGRCLIILDNVEQVADDAGELLNRWVALAPEAGFVATSRVRLARPGERVLSMESLPLEPDAVELFAARAPSLVRIEADNAKILEIVRTLDGLPLAIELAAAQGLPLEALSAQLSDRFSTLSADSVGRQSTLRATLDWSWGLLEDWERSTLAQCSAFAGGFTLESAEAVIDLDAFADAPWVVDAIQALVDKSLLRMWAVDDLGPRADFEEPFFGMYISVQEYAAEKLRGSAAAEDAAWRRHGMQFSQYGAREALDALHGPGAIRRRRLLALEVENLVAATRRAVDRGDASVATPCALAACEVFSDAGPYNLGVAISAAAAAVPGTPPVDVARLQIARGHLLVSLGRVAELEALLGAAEAAAAGDASVSVEVCMLRAGRCLEIGRYDEARTHYRRGVAIARAEGMARWISYGLSHIGYVCIQIGPRDDVGEVLREALAVARRLEDAHLTLNTMHSLIYSCTATGRLGEAEEYGAEALALARAIGHQKALFQTLDRVARVHRLRGDPETAMGLIQEMLAISRSVGERRKVAHALTQMCILLKDMGRMEEGLVIREQALAMHRELGNQMFVAILSVGRTEVLTALGRYAEAEAQGLAAVALNRAVKNPHGEAEATLALAQLMWLTGRLASARRHFAEAQRVRAETRDPRGIAVVQMGLAELEMLIGDPVTARAALETAAAALDGVGDVRLEAYIAADRARLCVLERRPGARALLAEARRKADASRDKLNLIDVLGALGALASEEGRPGARARLRAALDLAEESRSDIKVALIEMRLGLHEAREGRPEAARRSLGRALAFTEEKGLRTVLLEVLLHAAEAERLLGGPHARLLSRSAALAEELGIGPRSLLGQHLARLQA